MDQHDQDIKLNRLYENLTRSSISKWRFFFAFSKSRHELASHPNRQSFEWELRSDSLNIPSEYLTRSSKFFFFHF